MKRGIKLLFMACAVGALLASRSVADGETSLDRFARVLAGTRDVRARFTQVRRSPLLPEPMVSEGRLWLRRPGQLKLAFLDPEPMTLWKLADTTWIYLPSLAQVQRYRVESVGVPLGLVLGAPREELERSARIESVGDRIRLRPRADHPAAWSEITLELPRDRAFPTRLEILQTDGERLEFRFREVRRNVGVTAREMALAWPDSVEVVRVGR